MRTISVLHSNINILSLSTQVKRYLQFYSKASTIYSCHSPISYEMAKCLFSKNIDKRIIEIEDLRKSLKKDKTEITFEEYGAGSTRGNSTSKTVSQIANSSLSRSRQCSQLYNLVKHYKPVSVLEMGTSLGISTAYMASANALSRIISLEGDPTVQSIAESNFKTLGLSNIEVVGGQFESTLSSVLTIDRQIGMAFIDGNHRYQPTIDYFHTLLPHTTDNSILIFDDIYWSEEMMTAWEEVKDHEAVTMTIDLFHMGIVLLSKDVVSKQHLHLIEQKYKPWKIGLFGK